MDFRIADAFTNSLAKLTAEVQEAAKTMTFDLQMNPASPGMRLHKVERAKDKNFWSVRRGTTNIADRCVCRDVNGFGDLRR